MTESRHVSFSSVVDAFEDLSERENAVIAAACDFVATTSYWRQRKESREAFEKLAFAVLDLRETSKTKAPPDSLPST